MSELRDALSKKLLGQALKGETAESRAIATLAIGRAIRDLDLSEEDRCFAGRLFDHLSRDICEEVRRALAVTLKCSKNLPRHIANRLLNDLETIAVPILNESPVVTDDDLIVVLRSRAASKVRAIATRANLSERVSGAVISFGDGPAVAALAANDTALISKDDAKRLVKLAITDDLIREAALSRIDFPADLAASLIDRQVEDVDLRLPDDVSDRANILSDTRTRANASFATQDWAPDLLLKYVDALHQRGELNDQVIARAAGQGDWRFVQLALARMAGISVSKAGLIVFDPSGRALRVLCLRAGLGAAACALLAASAKAFSDLERSKRAITRRDFQRLMAERLASHPKAVEFEGVWLDWIDAGLELKAA